MLIPSIDLMGGKAVQLVGGRTKVLEVDDVLGLAQRWKVYGDLAVIDLDAALGAGDNLALVKELCAVAPCRVGGGVRTPERAHELLRAGASALILGTAATEDLLKKLPRERTLVAVDQRGGRLQVEGWREDAAEAPLDRVRRLAPFCGGFLMTVVDKEGRLEGVDWEAAKAVRAATDRPIVYAGGVTSVADVAALDRLGLDAQVGMALYQGLLDPAEAFVACLDWEKQGGLLPAAVQDPSGRLRMVAWVSPGTLKEALTARRGIFWSRSRQERWEKGATSGHGQELLRAEADCDRDTLKFVVRQQGPSCHTGQDTCFGAADFSILDLEETLRARKADPAPGSYTARLFREEGLLAAKLREEAEEVLAAGTPDELVWEGADLLYFLMARLTQGGVRFEQVLRELERRARTDTRKPGNAKGSAAMLNRLSFEDALKKAGTIFPPVPSEVNGILDDLRRTGGEGVFAWARKLDGFQGDAFEVPRARLLAAPGLLEPALRGHLEEAIRRVGAFARAQKEGFRDFSTEVDGMVLGQRVLPVRCAACYAPGGRYPLPSSVLMGVVPAKVAGVEEVFVLSPRLHPVTLAAAALAGADRVFDLGGVHGVAAAAWGLAGVPRADLIVGPGNRFVTGAKRLLYGDVGIDFPAGPSELLVLAGPGARPDWIAADLLAQAEHDPDAMPMLAVFDPDLIPRVNAELERQLALLPPDSPARESLGNGFAVVLADDDAAVALADALAPEHLELQGARAEALEGRFRNYGSLFVGEDAAEVFGDYGSGTNHILPTSGASRFTGGVSVATFLKLLTWQRTLPGGRKPLAAQAAALAGAEGLAGHRASALIREV